MEFDNNDLLLNCWLKRSPQQV